MGYRLEISKLEYADCGGKLFGYIEDEELHECKSWQRLKELQEENEREVRQIFSKERGEE